MQTTTECPSSDQLNRLLHDVLAETEQSAIAQHLESCEACQHALEKLAADSGVWRDAAQRLVEPATVDAALQSVMDAQQNGVGDGETHTEAALGHDVELDFLEPSDDPQRLGRLGGYEITDVIGYGGMGVVLKGHDAHLNRYVAIKVLMPELASNANARKRFRREGRAAAAVNHVHVATIHAVDEIKGMPLLVMEFIAGKSLEQRLAEEEPLQVQDIVRIGMQTAAGLAAAHAQGLVHRDIKPANILLENSVERVKISDFGLARAVDDVRITRPGVVTGTPEYMSPEQARGEAVDHRADLFSLGCVMYAMCAGRSPFRADSTPAVIHRVCSERPRPISDINPEVPAWLIAVIDKLLAKDRGARFQSAAEVSRLLERYLAHLQQPSAVPEPPRPGKVRTHGGRTLSALRMLRMPAVIACLFVMSILLTDAAGLTDVSSTVSEVATTVIRVVRGDGILEIRVDDPNVSVSIDGDEFVITGAGLHEVRVTPGDHELQYGRDGEPLQQQIVTIERGGHKLVEITQEPAQRSGADDAEQNKMIWTHQGLTEVMSISPDGRFVAVRDNTTNDLAVHDLKSGTDRRLTSSGPDGDDYTTEAVFSPDGQWLAYNWSNLDHECGLHVIRVDGSELRLVLRDEAGQWVQPRGWTPDGHEILCRLMGEETTQIVFVSVADGSHRVVKTLPKTTSSHPLLALSPDGQYIAYEIPCGETYNDPADIYLISADGRREYIVSTAVGDAHILGWTPDERLMIRSHDYNRDAVKLLWLREGRIAWIQSVREQFQGSLRPGQFTPDGAFYYVQAQPGADGDGLWVLRNFLPPYEKLERAPQRDHRIVWSDPQLVDVFSISPDETRLAFRDNDTGNLAVRNLEDGTVRRLSNNAFAWESYPDNARFSPDGRYVACEWRSENGVRTDVRIFAMDGGETRVLYTPDGEHVLRARPQDWSPDGRQLLVRFQNGDESSDETRIALISLDDGRVRILKRLTYRSAGNYGSDLRFSPDGRFIAYEIMPNRNSGNTDIALMSLDGLHESVLVANSADDDILDWSPDGKSLLFSRRHGRGYPTDAWLIDIEDGRPRGQPRLVMNGVYRYGEFAADGTFYDLQRGEPVQDVYLAALDPDTGAVQEGPSKASGRYPGVTRSGSWSPDGKRLASFVLVGETPDSLELSPRKVVIRSTETGEEREIPLPAVHRWRGGRGHGLARWSPDGTSLLLSGYTGNMAVWPNPPALFRLDIQTGQATRLITATDWNTSLEGYGWSAGGAALIYRRLRKEPAPTWSEQFLRWNLEDGTTDLICQGQVPSSTSRVKGAVSPDGSELALLRRSYNGLSLSTVPLAGGEPRILCEVNDEGEPSEISPFWEWPCLAWTPDGESLLFARPSGRYPQWDNSVLQLWRIRAEGGEAERLEFAAAGLLNLDIHPDGRHIAYTRMQRMHDLRATENLLGGGESE